MSNVVIQHIILLPLMLLVIIAFPIVANTVVSSYTNQQRLIMAQGAVNQLASTIQQLYYSLNQDEIKDCNVTKTNSMPETIDSYPYNATVYDLNGKLRITLSLQGLDIAVNKTVVLVNAQWDPNHSEFSSLSPDVVIEVKKKGETLLFSFKRG